VRLHFILEKYIFLRKMRWDLFGGRARAQESFGGKRKTK